MATCKNCGKPLIVSEGKCVYCGCSVQASSSASEVKPGKTSWVSKAKTTLASKTKTWSQLMIKKSLISIVAAIILGITVLIFNSWPGCLISISMLILAVALAIFCYQIIKADEEFKDEDEKAHTQSKYGFILNLLLIWGGCFFIAGIVCMSMQWWAVLIAELIGISLLILAWFMREKIFG